MILRDKKLTFTYILLLNSFSFHFATLEVSHTKLH